MKRLPAILFLIIFILSGGLPSLIYGEEGKTDNPIDKSKTELIVKDVKNEKDNAAVDIDQYIIGPEDMLSIYVWKEESLTKTVPVRIDGKISLPLVDDIQAAGLTPLKLKEIITGKLKGFVDNPTVTVSVVEANSYKVYLSGEVKNPGIMRIRSQTTLVKAIIAAGGFTEWANRRKILIITSENGKEKRIKVNYNKIVDGDETDVIINRGDTIIVN